MAYTYQPYPRWVNDREGRRRIVQNHTQEYEATGVQMNEDGTPFVAPKEPVQTGQVAPKAAEQPKPAVNADPLDGF